MKEKVIRPWIACMLCMFFLVWAVLALFRGAVFCAAADEVAEERISALLEDVVSFQLRKTGAESLQAWVDGSLAETADGTGGWFLMALRQSGEYFDDALCRERLDEAVSEEIRSITRRLRIALTRLALDMDSSFAAETADCLAEEKTLMPLVFGLHLMNNGITSERITREELISRLLAQQLEDGGWAVIGTVCDVDCTAMVLQAFAPLVDTEERIRASVDRGLDALMKAQQENGGFLGMGLESAESCAQVLLAFSCLGIDCEKNARFLPGGHSVLEAMLRFRLEDGSFAHTLGKGSNETATVQAFYALAGYRRFLRGESPYYLFDRRDAGERTAAGGLSSVGGNDQTGQPISQMLLFACIILAGSGTAAVAWFRRRRNWRTYGFIALVTLLLLLGAACIRIQSPESYYAGRIRTGPEIRTKISIRCDTVAGQNEYAPADGIILAETDIRIPEGGTAFDQLVEATRAARLQMEYDGTSAGAYVRSIAFLYEYDFGNLSGWMFRVNGAFADVGASQYVLREGDLVDWVYTTNIGKDIDTPDSF